MGTLDKKQIAGFSGVRKHSLERAQKPEFRIWQSAKLMGTLGKKQIADSRRSDSGNLLI